MNNRLTSTETNSTEPHRDSVALLTIDMQFDFANPAGSCFVPGTDLIRPSLHKLVRAFRQSVKPTFHAIRRYLEDGSNADRSRRETLRAGIGIVTPGTLGAELVDGCGLPKNVDTSNIIKRPGKKV